MASSMLSGERRWTSTRKSGMTVLGKVPKPINLPSQKLENHGLDPNVEIVPKGALTWGARPLLASSNAWGSSTSSSPRADGGVGSSILANGRPSSGGSGTRPSTGSSEKSSDPSGLSWGPSSRPSSASGIGPTSHVLVAANRPRSAETRPNSSQLSRFADSSIDSIAWGAAGTSEKVASEVSKRSDFTLTSGDFPTLGSEKSDEPKSLTGRSSKVTTPESDLSSSYKGTPESPHNRDNANLAPMVREIFNSWSAETNSHAGEDAIARENWHKDTHNPQPILDGNMSPRQFATWRGPPSHPPNVIWYGGHETSGPYRPFIPPGSYQVDPYYHYAPAGTLPNAQPFPRPEAYRHVPPESFIAHNQPGLPVRPGIYPGPLMYEGFHGPPRPSFGGSSEHDGPPMGMSGQYGVHNPHLPDNLRLQPWRFHDGSAPVTTNQPMVADQGNQSQAHYKVLLKPHSEQSEKEHNVTVWPTNQRGKLPGSPTPDSDSVNYYKPDQAADKQHDNDLMDDNNKHSLSTSKSSQHNTVLKKNAGLMEKVEGLNSKARVVDTGFESEVLPSKEKPKSHQNSKSNDDNNALSRPNLGANQSPHQLDELAVMSDNNATNYSENGKDSHSRNQKRAMNKGRVDHHYGKLKFGSYGADDMIDKTVVEASKSRGSSSRPGSHASQTVSEDQNSNLIIESVNERSASELVDDNAQHAKLKELARQRAIELQKKEAERTAEQKAKAMAKLEELNRRTSSLKQSSKQASPPAIDAGTKADMTSGKNAKISAVVNETLTSPENLPCESQEKGQEIDDCFTKPGDPPVSIGFSGEETTMQESNERRAVQDLQDAVVSKRKQTGFRRRRNVADERGQSERKVNSDSGGNSSSTSTVEASSEGHGMITSEDSASHPSSKDKQASKYNNNSEEFGLDRRNESKPPLKFVEPMPQPEKNSDEAVAPIHTISEPAKATSERASSNWKPHPQRKMAKNQQSDKPNAKYQGTENAVWAPVKPANKSGSSEQVQKSVASLDEKNGQDTQNGTKARRAEIERYVPKPIAKELSFHGDLPHSSQPISAVPSKLDLDSAATGQEASPAIPKTAKNATNSDDTKSGRLGKTRPSWRQRYSPEHEQSAAEGGVFFESAKGAQFNVPDHGKVAAGEMPDRRQTQSLIAPAESGEKNHMRTESQSVGSGQMRSQWQPKSQIQPQNYPEVHKDGGGQKAADKSPPSQITAKYVVDSESANANYTGFTERKATTKIQEDAKERKATKQLSKDDNVAMGRDFANVIESGSSMNADRYQELPGAHRRGHNRNHATRTAHSTPDTRNLAPYFEYETDSNKGGLGEEAGEVHRVPSGARYGVQGRNHGRRGGHFYGPRRGRAGGAYEMGG